MLNFIDFIGRVFISSVFLLSGYNKILNFDATVGWMEGFGVPGFLLWPTIILEILLPIFIIIGYHAKISAILLAFFSLTTAIIFHSDFTNQMQLIAFLKNLGLAGGFIFIAIHGTKDWALEKKKKIRKIVI